MKKTLTLLMLIGLSTFTFAQRNIDWSVEELIKPTELNSTATGTDLSVEMVLKNNGSDTVNIGDSAFYRIYATPTTANQLLFAAPNATSFYFKAISKQMVPGDTMHLNWTGKANLLVKTSVNIKFHSLSLIINRGKDPIASEAGAGLTNNIFSKDIVWFSVHGWGVGVNTITNNEFLKVSPNPASTEINIEWILSSGLPTNAKVQMYDMSGRLVLDGSLNKFGKKQLDVSMLKKGVYTVTISDGNVTSTKRIQILN